MYNNACFYTPLPSQLVKKNNSKNLFIFFDSERRKLRSSGNLSSAAVLWNRFLEKSCSKCTILEMVQRPGQETLMRRGSDRALRPPFLSKGCIQLIWALGSWKWFSRRRPSPFKQHAYCAERAGARPLESPSHSCRCVYDKHVIVFCATCPSWCWEVLSAFICVLNYRYTWSNEAKTRIKPHKNLAYSMYQETLIVPRLPWLREVRSCAITQQRLRFLTKTGTASKSLSTKCSLFFLEAILIFH